jgi:hypothetical protein
VTEPAPPVAIVDAAWRDGRLVYQAAGDGTPVWPPRLSAPGTGEPLAWHESAGRGTVYATTAIHTRDAEPRNICLVDLDEGVRIMSRIEDVDAVAVRIGMRVRARFTEPDPLTGARFPVFVPDDDERT